MMDEHTRYGHREHGEASYDEVRRNRFGSGGGFFGFGAGGRGLPWVFLWLCVGLVAVVCRLFYLQLIEGDNLAAAAVARRTNVVKLVARRGTIYDRNGNILATSEECYDVYANPKEIEADNLNHVVDLCAKYLERDYATYRGLLAQDTTFVYLERHADKDAAEELRRALLSEQLPGIYLISQMRRSYPYGNVAGQILGLVDVDNNGITGLELYYDSYLKGEDGEMILETGLGGTPIAGAASEVTKEIVDGQDLVLSLDIDVQRAVEQAVIEAVETSKAKSGMAMVSDPRTGEVIAACSTPYADITKPDTLVPEELNLRLVSSAYEPGSISKVLTAAIGLESGTVEASDYYTVPYSIMVGDGIVFDVDDRQEYEEMNLREMLRRSSNVAAALIAQTSIGAEVFSAGIASFGIGTLTGIDYPGETAGIVKTLGEYDASTLGSMAFGQGYSVPMVEMVRSVGAIANKGIMRTPHFATRVGDTALDFSSEERAVSELVAEKVSDMMCTVVTDGTASSAAVEGFEVAAKTGTGEIASSAGGYLKNRYLASLIGFAPADNPQVLVYVGLNETPYLSYSSAGPVFSAIMGEALSDLGVLASGSAQG